MSIHSHVFKKWDLSGKSINLKFLVLFPFVICECVFYLKPVCEPLYLGVRLGNFMPLT